MRRTISTLMVLGVISGCSGSQKSSAPAGDTQAPQVVITAPASVEGGETVALAVTVTDNVNSGLTATISCNGGTLTGTLLATPTVTTDTSIVCTATATDAAGNRGTGNVTITVRATVASLTVGEGQTSLLQGQAGLLVASNLALTETTYQGMLNGQAITLYRGATTGLSFLVPTTLAAGTYPLTVTIGTRSYSFPITVAAAAAIPDAKAVVSQTLMQARTDIDDFLSANGPSMTDAQRSQYTLYRQTVVDALAQIDTFSQADLLKLATQFGANGLYQAAASGLTGANSSASARYGAGNLSPTATVFSIQVCNTSANLFAIKNVAAIALIGLSVPLLYAPELYSKVLAAVGLAAAFRTLVRPGGVLSELGRVANSCYYESRVDPVFNTNVQDQSSRAQYVRAIAMAGGTGFKNKQPTSLRLQQVLQLEQTVAGKVTGGLAQLNQVLSQLPLVPESVSSVLNTIVPEKTQFVPSGEVSLGAVTPSKVSGAKGGSGEVITLTFSAEPAEQDIDFNFTLNRANGTPIPLSGTLIIAVPGADDAAFEAMQGKVTQTTVPIRGADSVEIVTQPAHGTATLTKDGLLTYTPSGQYFGSDMLTFRGRNANGVSRTATVSISVVRNFAGQWQITTRSTTTSQSSANLCPNETNNFSITVSRITDTQYTTSYQGFPITLTMSSVNDPAGLSGSTTVTYPDEPGTTTETVNARIPDSTHITGSGTFSYTGPNNTQCSGTTSITGVR